MKKTFFALGALLIICFGNLHTIYGAQFPYTSHIDPPQKMKPSRSCGEYLTICEASCSRRGDMYRFLCLGPDFTQGPEQYRCQCGDDAFRQVAKKEDKPESKEEITQSTKQEQEK